MRALLLISAGLLFLGILDLPIGYYTLLRIVVTIGAVAVVVSEFQNGFNFWVIGFGLTAIIFNPLIPIYLNDKDAWAPIDLLGGFLFLVKVFSPSKTKAH